MYNVWKIERSQMSLAKLVDNGFAYGIFPATSIISG